MVTAICSCHGARFGVSLVPGAIGDRHRPVLALLGTVAGCGSPAHPKHHFDARGIIGVGIVAKTAF